MDPRTEKERLRNAVPIEPEVLEEAEKVFAHAKRKLSLSESIITSIAVSLCHVALTRAEEIKTFAVKLAGDGQPLLMINVDFMLKIGAEQTQFALAHEVYHLLMMHLHTDPELMRNPNWVTAQEACINHRVMRHTKLNLIMVDGEVAIVDPRKVHDRYKKGMKDLGREPVNYEDFLKTDIGCFAALEELPKPIKPKGMGSCVHASSGAGGDGNSDPNGANNPAPLDQSEVDKFMGKVLDSAIQQAKNGRKGAKEEILGWMDASPEASKTWGDLGAGVLRGETTRTRKTDLWEKWTADIIGSRLEEGNRLRYNKKVPWDRRVTARGKQPKKHGAVFVDASGSMHQDFLNKVAALIGDMEELNVEWHSFDGDVWPFEVGEGFKGGGGTSFQIIDDHVENAAERGHECCEEEQDFVLVITDGYAPHIEPTDPEKWIWLITPEGDAWPEKAGMSCRQVDLP